MVVYLIFKFNAIMGKRVLIYCKGMPFIAMQSIAALSIAVQSIAALSIAVQSIALRLIVPIDL